MSDPTMIFRMSPFNALVAGCGAGCQVNSMWNLAYDETPLPSGPTVLLSSGQTVNSIQTYVNPGIKFALVSGDITPAGLGNFNSSGIFRRLIMVGKSNPVQTFSTVQNDEVNSDPTNVPLNPFLCISSNAIEPTTRIIGGGPDGSGPSPPIYGICPSVSTFTAPQQLIPGKWLIICAPPFPFDDEALFSDWVFSLNVVSPYNYNYPAASLFKGALEIVDGNGTVISTPSFTLGQAPGMALPVNGGDKDYYWNDGCGVGFSFDHSGSWYNGGSNPPVGNNQFYMAIIEIQAGQFLKFNANAAVQNYIAMGIYQECLPCSSFSPSTTPV
jgi:hypothetical protein